MVQAVLLFVADKWIVTLLHGQGTGGFQVARRITGRLPRQKPDGKWEYTSAAMARTEAGFQTMEEYIQQSQDTFA